MPYVISIVASRIDREYSFDKTPIIIGRLPKNDISIRDNSVSRQHARIVETGGGYVIEDLNSTNFVYLNKRKIQREVLSHGDIINIAGVANLLYFQQPDPALAEKLVREITDNPEFSAEALQLKQTMASLAAELAGPSLSAGVTTADAASPRPARRPDEFQALYEISYCLNSTLKLDQVLTMLVAKLLAVFEADRGCIMLFNANRQLEVRLARASEGVPPITAVDLELANRAVELSRAVMSPEPGRQPAPGAPSTMCAPLRVKSNIFGVICVESVRPGQSFARKDTLLFEALSHQAAIAMNNARLAEDLKDKQRKLETANRELLERSTRLQVINEKLDEKIAELEALNAVSRGMNMVTELDSVLKLILGKMIELLKAERGSLLLCNEEANSLEVRVILPPPPDFKPGQRLTSQLKLGEGVAGLALRQGAPVAVADVLQSQLFKSLTASREQSIRTLLCVPLIQKDRRIGVINITNKRSAGSFTEHDKQLAMNLANQAAITIENARNYTMAICDGLTSLYVHRYFQLQLDKEFERTRRHDAPLSLVMLDIDDFKSVNDTYGHQFGDIILQEVAALVRKEVRTIDLPARYGGEEFAVVLPETDSDGALTFGERLRRRIASQSFCYQETVLPVTVSVGVASHPRHLASNKEQLIGYADKALYYSKATGKNRVSLYSKEMEGMDLTKGRASHDS